MAKVDLSDTLGSEINSCDRAKNINKMSYGCNYNRTYTDTSVKRRNKYNIKTQSLICTINDNDRNESRYDSDFDSNDTLSIIHRHFQSKYR